MVLNSELISQIPMGDLRKMFTVEFCPCCNTEQIIWSHGITECGLCKAPLAPCGVCMEEHHGECSIHCPYGCDGTENDFKKEITMPKIEFETVEDCEFLYSFL